MRAGQSESCVGLSVGWNHCTTRARIHNHAAVSQTKKKKMLKQVSSWACVGAGTSPDSSEAHLAFLCCWICLISNSAVQSLHDQHHHHIVCHRIYLSDSVSASKGIFHHVKVFLNLWTRSQNNTKYLSITTSACKHTQGVWAAPEIAFSILFSIT